MGTDLTPKDQRPLLIVGRGSARPMVMLGPGSEHRFQRRMVDVCFVFDTTGSMSDKIAGLVECMSDLVKALAGFSLDWRVTVVPFGDLTVPGDRIVADLPFVADPGSAAALLREMPLNSGGGNLGESCLEAVQAALAKPYRQEAVKVFVILTDEPALTHRLQPSTIERALKRAEVVAFVASPPIDYYRRWAEVTGGHWYEIGPHLDPSRVLAFLRGLVQQVARVASAIHTLAGGSVSRYRELPPDRRSLLMPPGQR